MLTCKNLSHITKENAKIQCDERNAAFKGHVISEEKKKVLFLQTMYFLKKTAI